MKTAIETLAKQLFTSNDLQTSSVTGFRFNKDYKARPGLSPSRRSPLESELKRWFHVSFAHGNIPALPDMKKKKRLLVSRVTLGLLSTKN